MAEAKAETTQVRSRKAAATKEAVTSKAAAGKEATATKEAAGKEAAATKEAATKTAAKAASKTTGSKRSAVSKQPAATKESAARSNGSSGSSGSKAATGARSEFLARQRASLLAERANYLSQAEELKAQADSLALEHEPGDVQFDEEGGEGGTSNVDRELDLLLSAQARASITEIDVALAKIENGTYGICEQCGAVIPEARLEALPHASLCVSCKNGGLSSRR